MEGAIRHFKEMVTCSLMAAVVPGGAITEEHAPWAADYVAWMHERYSSERFKGALEKTELEFSPWRLNTGESADVRRVVPFGTPGYAFI